MLVSVSLCTTYMCIVIFNFLYTLYLRSLTADTILPTDTIHYIQELIRGSFHDGLKRYTNKPKISVSIQCILNILVSFKINNTGELLT